MLPVQYAFLPAVFNQSYKSSNPHIVISLDSLYPTYNNGLISKQDT